MNLLKETEEDLRINGKSWNDVEFVSNGAYEISIENFKVVAAETDYNEGFGHICIPLEIKIVGKDWWLERYEYDGQECWVYKSKPTRPENVRKLKRFTKDMYSEECMFEGD